MLLPSDPDRLAPLDRDPVKDRLKREALRGWKRSQEAHAKQYAHRMERLADLAEAFADDPEREAILEAAGTARMGQHATSTQLEISRRLREVYPQALQLLKQGLMFVRTVEILLSATRNASDLVQREVGRRLIPEIVELDAADVSRRVAAVLPEVEAELEGEAQLARHEQAKANRGMWVKPVEDGMARIGVETDQLSAAQFAAGFAELDRAQAEVDRRDGIKRSAGQRQADLFVELPARYLALTEAVQQGRTEELLDEAAARNAAARAGAAARALGHDLPSRDVVPEDVLGQQAVVQELPLGLPPAGRPKAWQLPIEELVAQLLRVPVTSNVVLNVHTPMTTLLEIDQRACRLDMAGRSYLPAFHARALLPTAALKRVVVDHLSGIPIAVEQLTLPAPQQEIEIDRFWHRCPHDGCDGVHEGSAVAARVKARTSAQRARRAEELARRTQRRRLLEMVSAYVAIDEAEPRHDPSAALRALVQLRDQTSRGIGSRRPARSCDLDHREDWAKGGQIAAWNLDAQGKREHHSKDGGWIPERDEQTGVMTWTSPLGSVYKRNPAWDPPPPIRDSASIPSVSEAPRPEAPRDREEDPDRPLWRDPRHQPRPEQQLPAVPEEPQEPKRDWWPDDQPPPF